MIHAAIFPLDLVKTRLQNQTAASSVRYNGLLDGLRKTFATDGLTGAYRGLTPNLGMCAAGVPSKNVPF